MSLGLSLSKSGSRSLTLKRSSTDNKSRWSASLEDEQTGLGHKLQFAIRLLETANRNTFTRVRHTLQPLMIDSDAKKNQINNWTDFKGLDFLHNCIVHNQPKIIEYILKECRLFQPKHQPKLNPYAHLAAVIGHKECLAAVLAYRPDDYFPASEPRHMIKLPPDIARNFKLADPQTPSNKSIDRLLTGIRRDTFTAETEMERNPTDDHIPIFEEEVKNFKEALKRSPSKSKRSVYVPAPDSAKLRISSALSKYVHGKRNKIVDRFKKRADCKITTHWDVFHDNTLDRTAADTSKDKKDLSPRKVKLLLPTVESKRQASLRQSAQQLPTATASDKRVSISQSRESYANKIELGVRKIQKYKDFVPVITHKRQTNQEDQKKYLGKTPLTLAAEKKHFGSVNYLLNTFHVKRGSTVGSRSSISLAASARSPEAIAALLEHNNMVPLAEYQSAVLLSLREMYPDTLSVLLTLGGKNRSNLFDGVNLYHMLYTQSLHSNHRHEMLPEMTRVLITAREDVNARSPPRTYPLYTLIRCAFNVWKAGKSLSYLACLKMLLSAKANPNFDERKVYDTQVDARTDLQLSRPLYRSAIHCVLINAQMSINNFDNIYWPQIIMQKLLETVESCDRMARRVNNDVLFYYVSCCCELGLNRRVLKILLRYGANPDFISDGKYPLNVFFEYMLPFFTKFEVDHKTFIYGDMLEALLLLCRAMSPSCLHNAVIHFLDNHFLTTPLQALDLTHRFCYHVNKMITCPRPLTQIVSQAIWVNLRRNAITVRSLPISEDLKQQILPSN